MSCLPPKWQNYGRLSFTVSFSLDKYPVLGPSNPLTGFWMSDKPLVQQALASELADLLLLISSTASSLAFLKGFWEAMVREWNGIDRLRLVSSLSSDVPIPFEHV